jgi:hypothetical protein
MKTIFCLISVLFITTCIHAQQLSQVSFSGYSNVNWLAYGTDQDVLIRISPEGQVLDYGIEVKSQRYNYYAPKLQPYMGKIEFYGNDVDSMFRGKLRSIGICSLTYYASYEKDGRPGKLKSIGRVNFDYYNQFDDKMLQGKIKFAGTSQLQYYSSFDEENFRGKLKAIGSISLAYYSMFDDKLIRGRLKSIGTVNYIWYTSADRSDLRGMLKSPAYRQNIGGITYILGF